MPPKNGARKKKKKKNMCPGGALPLPPFRYPLSPAPVPPKCPTCPGALPPLPGPGPKTTPAGHVGKRVWRGFGCFFNGLPNAPGWIRFSMVCPTGLEGVSDFVAMVCPTPPGGFVFQWFAQRVWRGFGFCCNGLPNGPGRFVFQWFDQRVWRGFVFFFQWSAQRVWRGFVFQWSAQRARADSFFNGSPTGLEGFRNSFSMVCPTGPGDLFFNGSPNGSHLGRFGWDLPPTLPGGHFWRDPAPAQVGHILAKTTLAIQVLVERIWQGLGRLRLLVSEMQGP